jgi:hypothetical protein
MTIYLLILSSAAMGTAVTALLVARRANARAGMMEQIASDLVDELMDVVPDNRGLQDLRRILAAAD